MKNLVTFDSAIRRRCRLVALCCFVLLPMACAPVQTPAPEVASTAPQSPPLGPGDRLRVEVYGQDQLTTETDIDDSGTIAIPLIGRVQVDGKTPVELEEEITKGLSPRYLSNPRVRVLVVHYRQIYVIGEVNKPGAYDYSGNMTMIEGIALGGGFTYRADQNRVTVRRSRGGDRTALPATAGTRLLPGDVIDVPERFF